MDMNLAGCLADRDPTRALVLYALLDGKAYTASELSDLVGSSPQNTSMHLVKLIRADLVTVEKQGRHRYYRFSRQEAADAMEAIASLVPAGKQPGTRPAPGNGDIRYLRSCYDHPAGRIGVAITDSFLSQQYIVPEDHGNYNLTPKGQKLFRDLSIPVEALRQQRRIFAKPCLDWSERRHHLAGSLGAALLDKMIRSDWARKKKDTRVLVLTEAGRKALGEILQGAV